MVKTKNGILFTINSVPNWVCLINETFIKFSAFLFIMVKSKNKNTKDAIRAFNQKTKRRP